MKIKHGRTCAIQMVGRGSHLSICHGRRLH